MEGSKLLTKHGQRRQGDSIVLCVNGQLEFLLGIHEELTDSLWVEVASASKVLMGNFCHRDNCWRDNKRGLNNPGAFDDIPHDNFVSKLERHGFDGWIHTVDKKLAQWSHENICDQELSVQVKGVLLRPVLFSIFVDNMDSGTEVSLSKLTDDMKLCGAVAEGEECHPKGPGQA
ncbi:rna-directed dna polymerase from mobile element jockey-like [Willisornis vidua]|uniref:Rna-directed dna polymerase from mobile element jockey-like n=1 Tax=Willisornis vidua TaxID=1566151 RepID=A0ABQ9CVC3_9PASS|nr:rna-directed dna polymerase from mobile element jockey-like [Willisornis vidua]